MAAQRAQQDRVLSANRGLIRATRAQSPRFAGDFICLPIHHCSILLQSDRQERARLPERRKLPRKRWL